jgi:hypothetical protein
MMLEGSHAVARPDGNGHVLLRQLGQNRERQTHFHWVDRGFGSDCVYTLQQHVIDHFRGHGSLENAGLDYLRNLHVEQAEGRAVDITPSPE